jgi:rhodanese-related sulfurtransferase
VTESIKRVDAKTLKEWLHDGDEIALLDAREEVPFDRRHLLMASCVPVGGLELLIDALVPRRSARVVWCDDGDSLAECAATRMTSLGYTNVHLLDGGVAAWDAAGFPIYNGVHVPSKAFAEVVEHEAGTPHISAEELQALIDAKADIAIYDTRTYEEYHGNSIPGAVCVPGAELVYRFADLTPSPDTTVIVNCGGRTRSIIGAQALINAGFPNKIVSLKNGTQAWHLSGFDVVVGATRRPPAISHGGLASAQAAAARVAARFNIKQIVSETLDVWRAERDQHSLYILDVRTPEEFEAGHIADARLAPGGQLVQETDVYLGVWSARAVLIDDDGVRATLTASWLIQMGWTNIAIMTVDPAQKGLAVGSYMPNVLGHTRGDAPAVDAATLQHELAAGKTQAVDLAPSKQYREGHIPGAWFALRSELNEAIAKLPDASNLVLTSPDGVLAELAAADLAGSARVLEGGTQAWTEAGLPLESDATQFASAPDDIRLKAREQPGKIEDAMREYLAWEIDLVNRMAVDDDHRFKILVD